MDKKFVGIVLNKIDYKEKDNLINVFSVTDGLMLCKLKGVKGASAKLKVLASPFCLAEFTAVVTSQKTTITSGEVIDSFYDITKDIDKYYSGCCVLDFVKQILNFQTDDFERLFTEVVNFLKMLCYTDKNCKVLLIKCLLNIIRICGFDFDLEFCTECKKKITDKAFVDVFDNSIKCENCIGKKAIEIDGESFKLLNQIKNSACEALNFTADEKILNDTLKIIGNYIYCAFDYTIKINELINTYWAK